MIVIPVILVSSFLCPHRLLASAAGSKTFAIVTDPRTATLFQYCIPDSMLPRNCADPKTGRQTTRAPVVVITSACGPSSAPSLSRPHTDPRDTDPRTGQATCSNDRPDLTVSIQQPLIPGPKRFTNVACLDAKKIQCIPSLSKSPRWFLVHQVARVVATNARPTQRVPTSTTSNSPRISASCSSVSRPCSTRWMAAPSTR